MKASKISAVGGVKKPKDDIAQTRPIKHIQTGVTDGKTGKPSMYVFRKTPGEKGFDVKKDRETVYTDNLTDLQRTAQYQEYRRRLATKK